MTQAFNLSQFANNVNTSGQASLTAAVSGTLPVANGGTGATSLTANNVILGNGTGAVQVVAPSTSGNVLTSNGSTWISAAGSSYAGFSTVIFASSGTWAVPTGVTKARITVIGGGAGGSRWSTSDQRGGGGGLAIAYCTGISGTLTITVGAGGASASSTGIQSTAGGTSSVTGTGVSVSATGGASGTNGSTPGAGGVGSVSTGTAIARGYDVFNTAQNTVAGTSGNAGSSANVFNSYIAGPIPIAGNRAVSNTSGGAGAAFSVGGLSPAGAPGFAVGTTKAIGGVVIIEY
jgi:hypothetical protein